jgi:NAD(P)-dependent dehydrogenase (short-subunit alcohol dehydrogenase family)
MLAMKLENKVALITGGNSGIGLATARRFVAEGARVVVTGRNRQKLEQAAAQLGPNVVTLEADVTDQAACEAAVSTAIEHFGRLDIVFANAGVAAITAAGHTTGEAFHDILRTNVTAAFLTVQAALPHLKEGASVIFNGSVLATAGPAGLSAYAASKGALRSMCRVLASELAPRGIRVNTVAAGAVRTPIWSSLVSSTAEAEMLFSKHIPLGRFCDPSDVANALLYLASDDSSYVTAAEIVVDGGSSGAPSGAPVYRL